MNSVRNRIIKKEEKGVRWNRFLHKKLYNTISSFNMHRFKEGNIFVWL